MKNKLLYLIEQIDTIKSSFHEIKTTNHGFPNKTVIYDSCTFLEWAAELQLQLQKIYDRTHDHFIWNTLVIIKQEFNGWNDEKAFAKLSANLHAIKKNIGEYYDGPEEYIMESETQKNPKIFISHSSKDEEIVSDFVKLLQKIGLNQSHIFCTSMPGYGISVDDDIYNALKNEFDKYQVHVIFVLSDNYYHSVACLNEMGATWVLQAAYTSILLPGFNFSEIEGAVNPRKMSIKLDEPSKSLKVKLGQLKNNFVEKFNLTPPVDLDWEEARDEFIQRVQSNKTVISDNGIPSFTADKFIKNVSSNEIVIPDAGIRLLATAVESNGQIIKSRTFDGMSVSASSMEFVSSQDHKEVAEWEDILERLQQLQLIKAVDLRGELYEVTKAGYDFVEKHSVSN